MSKQIYVYADWLTESSLVGTLTADYVRQKEHFSFSYDTAWLAGEYVLKIDPDLQMRMKDAMAVPVSGKRC